MKIDLHNIDCIEYMATLPDKSFDLVLTDPPYGLGIEYNSFNDTEENVSDLAALWLPEARRISHNVAFTCGTDRMHLYDPPNWVYAWYTPQGVGSTSYGFQCWQPIMYYGRDVMLANRKGRRSDVITWSSQTPDKSGGFHPCPKPVEFFEKCLSRFAVDGFKVFDPFLGSGSSAIAAHNMGFDLVGCELDKEYYDAACKRLADHQKQLRLI